MEYRSETPTGTPLLLVAAEADHEFTQLASVLSAAGYRVEHVGDGEEALGAFRETSPGLVLIDLDLPDEGAIQFCRALRRLPAGREMPIVMLHAGEDPDSLISASHAGATEFLERPYHTPLVMHRLRSALACAERRIAGRGLRGNDPDDSGSGSLGGLVPMPMSFFLRQVEEAIARTKNTELSVALLSVSTYSEPSSVEAGASAQPSAGLLGRAVVEFEQEERVSHPRGGILMTRSVDGSFTLLVPDLGRIQDAARLGYKIQELVEAGENSPSNPWTPGVCIGVATCPGDSVEALPLFERAAEAANLARGAGRGALSFRNEATSRWVFERLTMESSLRSAIENDELVVHYQPKVEIGSLRLVGFEALVRWQHPELGLISPAQFIPLAEETGQIVPIGEWVLETACQQNRAWQDAGAEPVRMAVNLSPIQFRQVGLASVVGTVLERTGMPAELLELEVTESMLMHDIAETIEMLDKLKAAGVYLSIDDFGTGYSSLSYLKGFPIDALKIDRSFVRDVTANADDAAIATSIILMGRSLNLKVIAEGVETESQRSFLHILQCDEIQGYLVSPPVPAEEAASFLIRSRVA